ncbi:MAG: TetR/AcrR family transcriptional regulator [Alphaproteobacteria bacterium]
MIVGDARPGEAAPRSPGAVLSARRKAILQAALRCFTSAGYEWTTIRDICAESGASIGSVYHLFEEKQSIAGALYLDGVREWVGLVAEAVRGAPDAEAAARGAVRAYLDWIADNPQWYAFCAGNRVLGRRSSVRRDVDKVFRALDRVLGDRFAPAAARGEVAALAPDAYRPMLLGVTYSIMIDRLCRLGPDAPPDAWLPSPAERDALADSAWRGLRR